MGTINEGWYSANEGRSYPLHDAATAVDHLGGRLPPDLLADLQLRYPADYGPYAFLAALSVTPALVTLTFEAADDLDDPSTFRPLAAISVARTAARRHVPLLPQAAGVAGWAVLGSGARDREGYHGRFLTPRAGWLAPRAARPYRRLPIAGVRDFRAGSALTGVVLLRAEEPLYLRLEDRTIEGVSRPTVVIGLAEGPKVDTFLPGRLDDLLPREENVLGRFAGPCAGRPETGNCGDPEPIEFINAVGPDCSGLVTLVFRGCAHASRIEELCGIVLDCSVSTSSACPPQHLPDGDGNLPDDPAAAVSVSNSDCG